MSVLIIEDDEPFRELIQATLEPRPVRFADTYAQAMKLIGEKMPDAVLLDLSLPDSTPSMTIKRIADIKAKAKDCPVIVITGSPEVYRLHNEAVRSGADYVLSKDNGFFDALGVALDNIGRRLKCTAQPTVEQVERVVGNIVTGH